MNRVSYLKQIFLISVLGWFGLSKKTIIFLWQFLSKKTILDRTIIGFLVLQLISSSLGWFRYEIKFFEFVEPVSFGSKWNFLFFLGSAIAFVWFSFWQAHWILKAFQIMESLLLLFFFLGIVFPNTLFTDMQRTDDYSFTTAFYGFAVGLCGSLLLSLLHYRGKPVSHDPRLQN